MRLSIMLSKEVETVEQAQTQLDIVKSKLEDFPDVTIIGSVSETLIINEE